jgi:hypothetical protein
VLGDRDKDAEILALRYQLTVLQREIDKPKLTWPDPALLAALLHHLPRAQLRRLQLIVTPDTLLRTVPGLRSAATAAAGVRLRAKRVGGGPSIAGNAHSGSESSPQTVTGGPSSYDRGRAARGRIPRSTQLRALADR